MQTFKVSILDFAPAVTETDYGILITVHTLLESSSNPSNPDILGFIRFKKDPGSVELINFGASLDSQCLEIGYSSKLGQESLAGGHGEGLKVAALVLCRNHYRVHIAANSLYWNFGFGGTSRANFYCRLSEPSANVIHQQEDAYENQMASEAPRGLTASIGHDVSVLIGRERGRDRNSDEGRVSVGEFQRWMETTVDLDRPSASIRTPSGDLILDPRFAGRIYLKGLQLPMASSAGNPLHYGYNLFHGSVNRDRRWLIDSRRQAEILASIWESAIKQDKDTILPRYVDLLRYHPSAADVGFADHVVSALTANHIWAALLREAIENGLFYYCQGRADTVSGECSSPLGIDI